MRTRAHTLVVLVLALAALAVGGVAGTVSASAPPRATVGSADVRDGSLTGRDVRDRTLAVRDLRGLLRPEVLRPLGCSAGEQLVFGECLTDVQPEETHPDAVATCAALGGRLPTLGELLYLTHHSFVLGDPPTHQWSGDLTVSSDPLAASYRLDTGDVQYVGAPTDPRPFRCLTATR